jgi:hypothetical protein
MNSKQNPGAETMKTRIVKTARGSFDLQIKTASGEWVSRGLFARGYEAVFEAGFIARATASEEL